VWRNGSASASQAEGCGFESRRPLQISLNLSNNHEQRLVRHLDR
jgi:hypothetical protein